MQTSQSFGIHFTTRPDKAKDGKEPIYVCNLGEIFYKLHHPKKALEQARKAKIMGYASAMLNEIIENKGKIPLKEEIKIH